MATVRRTIEQVRAQARVNREKMAATTEEDIERHMREDGGACFSPNIAMRARLALGLTQQQLAERTRIPVASIRNWEQNRTKPDAAAMALFDLLVKLPKEALKAWDSAA